MNCCYGLFSFLVAIFCGALAVGFLLMAGTVIIVAGALYLLGYVLWALVSAPIEVHRIRRRQREERQRAA